MMDHIWKECYTFWNKLKVTDMKSKLNEDKLSEIIQPKKGDIKIFIEFNNIFDDRECRQ